MKAFLAKIFAKYVHYQNQKWINHPIETQDKTFHYLLKTAQNTRFGKDHDFASIQSYEDFKARVPVRDYEGLKNYFDAIIDGEENVTWPGKPLYLAKTSGTTSGAKAIPLTKESIPTHIKSARNALLAYIYESGNASFLNGKMIFLQGNPELTKKNGIQTGRLSGIVAHFVPDYLQKNRMPSWDTNCIEDWEEKVDAIVDETQHENMTLISGIPPWMIMYFEKLLQQTDSKTVKELFPHLQLLVTGGVNYDPYRDKMNALLGKSLPCIQTYPASEGFFAYQDSQKSEELLLLLDNGIFYEFIPAEEFHQDNPTRISLESVELKKDYVLILSSTAGLWAYNIGDTVRFTSIKPYKIIVSGRIKHFTSAFGEHVIAHEVETALQATLQKFPASIIEFSVAPQVNPNVGLPYHEWLIEFGENPTCIEEFEKELDRQMCLLNVYYQDLINGNVLRPLKISLVKKHGFQNYMKSLGKLGGQNKVPRLANDRLIADKFYQLDLIEKPYE